MYYHSPCDVMTNWQNSSFDGITNYKMKNLYRQLNPPISPPSSHCLQIRVPQSFFTNTTLRISAMKILHVSGPLTRSTVCSLATVADYIQYE